MPDKHRTARRRRRDTAGLRSVPTQPATAGLRSVPAQPATSGLRSVPAQPATSGLRSVPARPDTAGLRSVPGAVPNSSGAEAAGILAVLHQADQDRAESRWVEALTGYEQGLVHYPDNPALQHNIALCHYSLGQLEVARQWEEQAWKHAPQLWQSGVLLARILLALRQRPQALEVLRQLHRMHPGIPEIRLDLALQTLHQLGDAVSARELVAELLTHPGHGKEAQLTTLITELYDSERSDLSINQDFRAFAARHLHLPEAFPTSCAAPNEHRVPDDAPSDHNQPEPRPSEPEHRNRTPGSDRNQPEPRPSEPQEFQGKPVQRRRLRVGLLSPQFFVSPVYFFTIGALRHLAGSVDLLFFSRDRKADWATAEYRALATAWIDVAGLDPEALNAQLQQQQLDILVDLGGWMDPQGLRALSRKPARRLYKWVGGQSITTGIPAFDGFISDYWQTPPGSESLFVEPLIRLPSGYVSYSPPPYLPAPQAPAADRIVLGIMSNPAKISRRFLDSLRNRWAIWSETAHRQKMEPPQLRFIDRRYIHPALVERLRGALPGVDMEFIVPPDHPAYLSAVGGLHAVLDTMPYSGGLTTIEALAMGVPCFAAEGTLFCQRHTTAHLHYAGLDVERLSLAELDPFTLTQARPTTPLGGICARLNHLALAASLFRLFETGPDAFLHHEHTHRERTHPEHTHGKSASPELTHRERTHPEHTHGESASPELTHRERTHSRQPQQTRALQQPKPQTARTEA